MLDLRPVFYALGAFVCMLAVSMLIPALVDLFFGHPDWPTFLIAMFVSGSFGIMMMLATQGSNKQLNLRQAFLLTISVWIILPAIAALPMAFSILDLSYTDAYFEAMSGLTTTGSTVIVGLDDAPPGILLWRAILQWLGGIGVVVMAIAILPMLQIGGMQLFKTESFDTSEKILPRAGQISGAISGLYVAFTAICAILMMLVGLSPFDAIVHAMTSIATGGFSTSDASIGQYDSVAVEMVSMTFILIGSLPFILYLQVLRGRTLALWRDQQVKTFLIALLTLILVVAVWLMVFKGFTITEALRYGGFNIVSIMTGTGYASTDYGQWGSFSVTLFFFVMFIGGCAGSTSCGIKIFRFQVLFKSMKAWINKTIQPNGVFIPRYNGSPIARDVQSSVLSFLILFFVILIALTFLISLTGVDWVTAFSGVGTALANVGPGLGDIIGPAGTFKPLPDTAKWLLSFTMLIGRLELFAVLVLFTPTFWRG
ncbi:TrkH family potassium uptake protein [Kordiimonas sp. SCSIO 12610]|uniref:TrkH family potassium uptake protein n=1 Tax=Kordiimonas sp. SCSIO 12610 TaxID=2829597 RepID=UPI0021091554|nr:TrkH family potassium uptake protein [Kordiimonas sp. SCSIO 12610]UTW55498.1 TrkH family potassium uptake protein [Kordiimonas sp. SCSIO 12610]